MIAFFLLIVTKIGVGRDNKFVGVGVYFLGFTLIIV
jgi:hypothetical protein